MCGFDRIQLVEECSEVALASLLKDYEKKADLIFIDGLHTFDTTLSDMLFGLKLLKTGGIMVIDDCRMPPVAKAVAYFHNLRCIKTLPGSPNNSSSLSRMLSLALRQAPKPIASVLPNAIYNYFYPRSWMSTMMALQKVGDDNRHWNWHKNF